MVLWVGVDFPRRWPRVAWALFCARVSLSRSALLLVVAMFSLVGSGCTRVAPSVPAPSDGDLLRSVISTYRVASRDLGRPPKTMDELKAVLAGATDDPMKFLRSKRDGEAFVVVWGVNLEAQPQDAVIAYERTGVNGKRMVVTISGHTREVSAEELASLKFPKGYEPES